MCWGMVVFGCSREGSRSCTWPGCVIRKQYRSLSRAVLVVLVTIVKPALHSILMSSIIASRTLSAHWSGR